MPRDKLLGDRFSIQKFKWYLIDLRDYHNPVLVRKHLDSKYQAIWFKEKYYDENYDIIYGKEAKKYGLRDFLNVLRRHGHHTAKYNYPTGCETQYEHQLFRNQTRRRNKADMRQPKVTETIVWEILDDKPVLFVKRVKHYADNHFIYSQKVTGLAHMEKFYPWPKDLRHLSNIVRVLVEYYNTGLYPIEKVALFIYKKWGARIRRHCDIYPQSNPKDPTQVLEELRARGFQDKFAMELYDEDNYIESIGIKPTLAHHELCWHNKDDRKDHFHYVYDFQAKMGIPGWVRANVSGLAKRI